MAKPVESPAIAPALAATAIQAGDSAILCWVARTAAVTSAISPGTGMPRLSTIISRPTIK
jgi:hypothetical protein